jgi:hypothetical protein
MSEWRFSATNVGVLWVTILLNQLIVYIPVLTQTGLEAPRISKESALGSGKVVSPKHRLPLLRKRVLISLTG